MLPIILTIGHAVSWLALTVGQLFIWGAGISLGFWGGKQVTNKLDVMQAKIKAKKAAHKLGLSGIEAENQAHLQAQAATS